MLSQLQQGTGDDLPREDHDYYTLYILLDDPGCDLQGQVGVVMNYYEQTSADQDYFEAGCVYPSGYFEWIELLEEERRLERRS